MNDNEQNEMMKDFKTALIHMMQQHDSGLLTNREFSKIIHNAGVMTLISLGRRQPGEIDPNTGLKY